MKKFILGILILVMCLFIGPATALTYAEENVSDDSIIIQTLYPEDILDYQNLENIDKLTINENFIAYTQSSHKLTILNKTTKAVTTISDYSNITAIKFVKNNQLLIADYNTDTKSGNIKIITINNDNNITTTPLSIITLDNLRLIDIYSIENKVYIGLIKDSVSSNSYFELYEIENKDKLSTPELIDTYPSDLFNTATLMAINESSHFVVFKNEDDQLRLIHRIYDSTADLTPVEMMENVQLLDYFKYNESEYLVMFTKEILNLLSINNVTTPITYLKNLNVNNIDIFDNAIYACDSIGKTIISYNLVTNESDSTQTLNKDKVIISSKDKSLGRFNSVSDINIQGSTLYISDTKNDRIQIIENNKCYEITESEIDSNIHSVILDSNQNIYFVKKLSLTTSALVKYAQEDNHNYSFKNSYTTCETTNIGLISDATINNNDEVFLIDYSTNKLLYLSKTGLQAKTTFSDFTADSTTKIEYIKFLNKFVISNQNKLYLLNPDKLSANESYIEDILTMPSNSNIEDITADLQGIYALSDTKIYYVSILNDTMQVSEKYVESQDFSNFSNIKYDIANNQIFAFNADKQCINYFNISLGNTQLSFDEIKNNELLEKSSSPLAITIINNGIIYDQPYFVGEKYEDIDACIGIELYEDYYRVLFKHDNVLKIGFLHKNYTHITPHDTSKKIKVLTTNFDVSIYKYPTLLKYENQAIITSILPIDTYIYISNTEFPISIDSKQFYLYETADGKIGYIFNADVILDDSTNIVYLNTENASINAIGEDSISIYSDDKTTVICSLENGQRIYVESYDKNSEYTKVIYKDSDLNTISGYVKTKYIEMDKLDNSKIILIILIILSIAILLIITISYILIKKKKQ